MELITAWFKRHFSNPQVVYLALILLVFFAVVLYLGNTLLPVLASIVIAYLLEGVVKALVSIGIPRLGAVILVVLAFLVFVILLLFGLLPLLSEQITQLMAQVPSIVSRSQAALLQLPERYPEFISKSQVEEVMYDFSREVTALGQRAVSLSLSSVVGIITLLVYVILMPILLFFFLKDKELIINWARRFMPRDYQLAHRVWREVDGQIANYIRGKFWEILIVGAVSFVTFSFFGLQFSMLLAVLVGLSVIIPYIGAAVVTLPVVIIAWFQFGWTAEFGWLVAAYLIIQTLDGNVLVPVLFSEVVDLHPVAIIVAVLMFGSWWGIWGVFFAIPLATLVSAVISAWPSGPVEGEEEVPPA